MVLRGPSAAQPVRIAAKASGTCQHLDVETKDASPSGSEMIDNNCGRSAGRHYSKLLVKHMQTQQVVC